MPGLKTLEEGIHTADICNPEMSRQQVGTQAFADAVYCPLGSDSRKNFMQLIIIKFVKLNSMIFDHATVPQAQRDLVGVDVYLYADPATDIEKLAQQAKVDQFELETISNRGTIVWPAGLSETFCTDHWRLRYKFKQDISQYGTIVSLLATLDKQGLDIIKTENLYEFEGKPGFSQ